MLRVNYFFYLKNYLQNHYQKVVFNGQTSGWRKTNSGVPEKSFLGSLLFLIYIKDLPDGITPVCKIFGDDTFFSKVIDLVKSVTELNTTLLKISHWTNQRKMEFKPDPKKKASEVIFSRKLVSYNLSHPPVKFTNNNINRCSHKKYLGIVLDLNLDFNTHINQKIKRCNIMISLIR